MGRLNELNLGQGFSARYFQWRPDRKINPQYEGIPDVERAGLLLTCRHGIEGAIQFDCGEAYRAISNGPFWIVESWKPLTLSPSVDCGCCHGYIKDGVWTDA